jgi:hypothetical protein
MSLGRDGASRPWRHVCSLDYVRGVIPVHVLDQVLLYPLLVFEGQLGSYGTKIIAA